MGSDVAAPLIERCWLAADNGSMRISQRAAAVAPFHAMVFGQRAGELIAAGHNVIRLSLGEPDFGAPPAVRAAMREVMDGRPLPYTPAMGLPALREAIADFYQQRHGVSVDPARIIVTAGASAALLTVLAATVDPGQQVVMADPSYPCNRALVETFGGQVRLVPSTAETSFQLTANAVADAWNDDTTAVMMASPANPTGTSIPFAQISAICDVVRSRSGWVIADEIYLDLADHDDEGHPARSVLITDSDAIVVSSFSKYFGMTGWRLGWAVLPELLVEPVARLATNYFLCAGAHTQLAALPCFTPETLAWCEQNRLELLARRELVLAGLSDIGLPVSVRPDGAFYVYLDVSGTGLDAWTFCQRALEEVHVALTPGVDFSTTTAQTHVRLSYAASPCDLRVGLQRLGEFVAMVRVA